MLRSNPGSSAFRAVPQRSGPHYVPSLFNHSEVMLPLFERNYSLQRSQTLFEEDRPLNNNVYVSMMPLWPVKRPNVQLVASAIPSDSTIQTPHIDECISNVNQNLEEPVEEEFSSSFDGCSSSGKGGDLNDFESS